MLILSTPAKILNKMRIVFLILVWTITFLDGCKVRVKPLTSVQVTAAKDEGVCYNLVPEETDWYGAAAQCKAAGGRLAGVPDKKAEEFLIKTIKTRTDLSKFNFWIGIYQRQPGQSAGFQSTQNNLNCDANPRLPRRECSDLPFHKLNKTECLQHYCCYLETSKPKCFYSPVRAPALYYSHWSRTPLTLPYRRCGSLSKVVKYQWVDVSCKNAFQQGYVCQFSEKQTPTTSVDLTFVWIILVICIILFIFALCCCICSCCIIRRRLTKRRPWWVRSDSSESDLKQLGQNGQYYPTRY